MIDKKIIVVLSGGQDSVTCLGIALAHYREVEAISFAYNQRHIVEIAAAADICRRHNVPHRMVEIGGMLAGLVTSALTDPDADDKATSKPHPTKPGLPASFVPGRNALFLTLAHAFAQTRGAGELMTGVCETDYSGYPDCREVFINLLQDALNRGYEANIQIRTPLMHLDKAHTFLEAERVNFLEEVLEHSVTCYNGDNETRHAWGRGCGVCPACQLRAKGYDGYLKLQGTDKHKNALGDAAHYRSIKNPPEPIVAVEEKKASKKK